MQRTGKPEGIRENREDVKVIFVRLLSRGKNTLNFSDKITAVILAGGMGTRLSSVVADRQKAVALVNGKPFLSYLFRQILRSGIKHAVLCTGYKAEMVEAELGSEFSGLKLSYSAEKQPLGTAGAVRLALDKVSTEYLLVMNGDSYIDTDFTAFFAWFEQRKIDAGIILTAVKDASRYGKVVIDDHERVIRFDEKQECAGSGLINAGIYLFNKKVLTGIPENVKFSMEKDVFPGLAAANRLFGKKSDGRFIDIGTPESYKMAEKFFQKT